MVAWALSPAPAGSAGPCPTSAAFQNVTLSNISATEATLSWRTGLPAPAGIFRGLAYAPGVYHSELSWVADAAAVIKKDVEAAAQAFFNGIVLYAAGPDENQAVHPYDQAVFDQAAASSLKIAFRLEWYPPNFAWTSTDCDAVVEHYRPYILFFHTHPGLLQYFLLNNPLDDTRINHPMPSLQKQRDYVAYCYAAIKQLAPGAPVYANTYYGWRDELPQAPVADLVDGVSPVVYAQHQAGAPYSCPGTPAAGSPLNALICKDQFDYYLDRSYRDNFPGAVLKPVVLDSTGFAPAASYASPDQKNGIVADSAAKAEAIALLRQYIESEPRLAGWSYFMLLPSQEAHWGLIDRRRLVEETAALDHQRTLTGLLPGQTYTLTLRAGSQAYPVTFKTADLPARSAPRLSVTTSVSGASAVTPGSPLKITWQLQNMPGQQATLRFFYDREDHGCTGTSIGEAVTTQMPGGELEWIVPPLPGNIPGMFYLYGLLEDEGNPPVCDYSPGSFVVASRTVSAVRNLGEDGKNITLDGRLDEVVWQVTPEIFAVHATQGDGTTAQVAAVWDETYLYLGFRVMDQQVESADPGSPWNDDSVSALFFNGQLNCRQEVSGTGAGVCERALALLPGSTPNHNADRDAGYTVEMRIPWAELHTTPRAARLLPVDFLSVDHDGAPHQPYNGAGVQFSKVSFDGDGSVDTTGQALELVEHGHVYVPLIRLK